MTHEKVSEVTPEEAVERLSAKGREEPRVPEAPALGRRRDEASLDALAEAERQRDAYLADLQRVAADFDNYRKRVARDQAAMVTRAHERLVEKLLPVLDDLERAFDAAEQHDEAKVLEGVRMTKDALAAAAPERRA